MTEPKATSMTQPVTGPGPTRLVQQRQVADRDEAEAARLLGVLGPSHPDPVMERRVYARLTAQPGRGLAWRRGWVIACVGLLLGTTALAATLVQRWLARPHPTLQVAPASATASPEPRPVADPPRPPAGQVIALEHSGEASSGPVSLPEGDSGGSRRPKHVGAAKPPSPGRMHVAPSLGEVAGSEVQARAAAPSPGEGRLAAARPEEAAMVLAGLRALRREHDPHKAGRLLDQYLDRFAGGVLMEEALALGIEAALDRHDAAGARRLGEQYLGRYPGGRFKGLAQKAMGSRAP